MASRIPVVDAAECTCCESCLVLCPSIFSINEQTGMIEVALLTSYPEEEIQAAISCCPKDCITWEPST